jgi:hypothetical protein
MSDFQTLMKFPPNSVADVLRRLTGALRSDPSNAPYLTIYLLGGASVVGSLLQFRKDNSHQFVVTLGNFNNEDGTVEAVSYVPLAQIAAITIHAPGAFVPILEEVAPVEDLQP